jgi:hypothetical protein
VKEKQDYLISLAGKKKLRIIGDNNPFNCGVTENDFNDFNHLNKTGLLHIFKEPKRAEDLINKEMSASWKKSE